MINDMRYIRTDSTAYLKRLHEKYATMYDKNIAKIYDLAWSSKLARDEADRASDIAYKIANELKRRGRW